MDKPFSIIFGGLIAFILLLLYAATVGYMINEVRGYDTKGNSTLLIFPDGLIFVVTTVGGLVSALVISKLTITKTGENPAIISMTETRDEKGNRIANKPATIIAFLYLFVWMATGLAALLVGTMIYPGVNSTVSDIGTTWLGLAVAAGYSYFGINPQN